MMFFGISMGFVFPVYANFFVEWKEGFFVFFVIGCIAAGITVGVVSFWFVRKLLIKELLKISTVANQIANNKVGVQLRIESDDAVGEIANGFNLVLNSLKEVIQRTKVIAQEIGSLGGNDVGKKGTIEYLKDATESVNDSAGSISDLSGYIRDEVKVIHSGVLASAKTLDQLDGLVNRFTSLISDLNQQMGKINAIVVTVKELASQTNILALNASIEATKAGVHGKSFAVVAGEVQKLSSNIGKSVVEITGITQDLNKDLDEVDVLNKQISEIFKSNQTENLRFSEIIDKVNGYTDSNLYENEQLKGLVDNLNQTVGQVNSKFEVFFNSVGKLNAFVGKFHD